MATKALELLQKAKSTSERATSFLGSIERNIQKDVLDVLQSKKDGLTDKIFELLDFTLETNLNSGQSAISRDQAEKRFKDLIEAEYQLKLVELELEAKQVSFNKYFKDESTITNNS